MARDAIPLFGDSEKVFGGVASFRVNAMYVLS
jgi:hypothetical protein